MRPRDRLCEGYGASSNWAGESKGDFGDNCKDHISPRGEILKHAVNTRCTVHLAIPFLRYY